MRLFVREIVGWIFVVLGLVLVGFVLYLSLSRRVVEGLIVALPAMVVFRSGIALVRIAIAGRIAAWSEEDRTTFPPVRDDRDLMAPGRRR